MQKFQLSCALFSPSSIFDLNPTLISPQKMGSSGGTGGPVKTIRARGLLSPGRLTSEQANEPERTVEMQCTPCVLVLTFGSIRGLFSLTATLLVHTYVTEPLPNLLPADEHSKTTHSQNWPTERVPVKGNFGLPLPWLLSIKVANWTLTIQTYLFAPSVRSARFIFFRLCRHTKNTEILRNPFA